MSTCVDCAEYRHYGCPRAISTPGGHIVMPGELPCAVFRRRPVEVDEIESLRRQLATATTAREQAERDASEVLASVKQQMATGYREREDTINRQLADLRAVYKALGEARDPGQGTAPVTPDAAIEDVQELEDRWRTAARERDEYLLRLRDVTNDLAVKVNQIAEQKRRLSELRSALTEAIKFLRDLSCDGCEYGDDCPPFVNTRHYECRACMMRREADRIEATVTATKGSG